jgi:enoyl-[acyl-carrier protein] reductase II
MTEECNAHPKFKTAFRRAHAREARATPSYDSRLKVIPVRALQNQGTAEFGKLQLEILKKLEASEINSDQAQLEVEKFWVGGLRKAAIDGDVEKGSLMAGQAVGLADEIKPIKAVIEELVQDADLELERISGII